FTGVLDMRRVVGMGRVFARVFIVVMLIMRVFDRRLWGDRLDRRHGGHAGFQLRDRCFVRGVCPCIGALGMVFVVMIVIVVIVRMIVIMLIMVVMSGALMMPGIILMM